MHISVYSSSWFLVIVYIKRISIEISAQKLYLIKHV